MMESSLKNPSPTGMRWEKRGMEENVKALILKDQGAQRRGEIYTTTISSPVSRTKASEISTVSEVFLIPANMIFLLSDAHDFADD